MPIELANIQLHRVHRIRTLEQASLVHHPVPGLEGSITQNLGRDSVRLEMEGIFYGPNARNHLEILRNAYKKREPVDFLADIVGQAYFSQVILERFEVVQSAERPEQFSYRLAIAESVSAAKSPEASKDLVNQAITQQAQNLMQVAALTDALNVGLIPELSNPVQPLTGAVQRVEVALEGIQAPVEGLQALFQVQLDAPAATAYPLPEPPQPAALKWGKQPATDASLRDLLKAGVPVKDLRSSGITVKALLKAKASSGVATPPVLDQAFLLELRQAGFSPAELLAAGVSTQTLEQLEQTMEALKW